MKNDSEFSREELLACVDREIGMRERVYSHQIEVGRLSEAKATREIAMMRSVRAVVAQLPVVPSPQASLFGDDRR